MPRCRRSPERSSCFPCLRQKQVTASRSSFGSDEQRQGPTESVPRCLGMTDRSPVLGDAGSSLVVLTALTTATRGSRMTDVSLEELGPVDYMVVEFPAGATNFTGAMAQELVALVDAGIIRVIDVLILTKNHDGTVEPMELSDVGELGDLQALEAQLAELLAEDDVAQLAAAMEPGSTAGVLIWENLWAAPFASAARRSGGQLIANGRIPIQAIIASIDADEASAAVGV